MNIGSHTAYILQPTACLILLHYPARTFRRAPGWIIFSLWFRFARKRRRENSLEMTADSLLSRSGDSLTNPLNSIDAVVFYLSRSPGRKRGGGKKEMRVDFQKGIDGERANSTSTWDGIENPEGNVSRWGKIGEEQKRAGRIGKRGRSRGDGWSASGVIPGDDLLPRS